MMINGPTFNASHLVQVAEAVSSLNQLSAVAAPGWCESAARILSTLQPGSVCAVRIARFASSGEASEYVASGCWNSDTQSPVDAETLAPSLESGSAWVASLGGAGAGNTSRLRVGRIRDLPQGTRWPTSSPGRRWAAIGIQDLVAAVSPLTGAASEYSLCVELGVPAHGQPFDGTEIALLKAVVPELSKRASIAYSAAGMGHGERLTSRELEVLGMLAQGKTVKQIAELIGRSPHTVHDHVKSLHRKLRASSRGELVARALGHPTEGDENPTQGATKERGNPAGNGVQRDTAETAQVHIPGAPGAVRARAAHLRTPLAL